MSWTYDRAQSRINQLKQSVPEVQVERFDEGFSERRRRVLSESGQRDVPSQPLFRLSNREAVLVDSVHVYVRLLGFDDALLEGSRETPAAHARALQFLHLHYNACDRAVEDAGAQRVDFHGQRMHAVVIEPSGRQNARERVRRALELAYAIRDLGARAALEFGDGLPARYRIGIDSGECVAISSGRGSEPEPLFLGHSANYAAKLAEGEEEGIFVSDSVRAFLATYPLHGQVTFDRFIEEQATWNATDVTREIARATSLTERTLATWRDEISGGRVRASHSEAFAFHYHEPPLRTVDYAKLMPSNSIRMPLVAIFGDIDGFTKYIQGAMATMHSAAEAVRNLHVIRGELAAVLREDFGGKKVRFIGDCIHGMYAYGSRTSVDEQETVGRAVHLAGAIRSSFDLCKASLSGISSLGIAIGLELGPTPVSRIGVRGDRSVRISTGKSTILAETLQGEADGRTTVLGPAALVAASSAVRRLFSSGFVTDLDYDSATLQIPIGNAAPAMPAILGSSGFKAHLPG